MLKYLLIALGTILALLMFVWFLIGVLGWVPSVIDVFGVENIKIPAGIAVGGLVLAAVGCEIN